MFITFFFAVRFRPQNWWLVIQALKEIGKDNVTEREISIILDYLKKEEPLRLTNDIKLAPEWILIIMRRAL
jgi:hypothetical protein